ncbi:Occlusion-derived virus envelope/capsid protein-43 [Trabala vishnou gigantina nucleopolyhedrovirus]|uniref:Occlusion-derived virus envelope/capsid protein-43 n=1 Tax=Trabala vishnou gigantina nucleopolyhedrovirus TaxID=2863583 RepID=UPI002481E444|nr:Occlusion-derived virus envelope/capsid protein-43 [Trabala vishnou gigantina nucleopolyhedrovirus]QYC92692.1 Occlusion-derived virus envelope/capsid protein-43 [Trabala vishnou gigantina nucleopolyhedrovirus]
MTCPNNIKVCISARFFLFPYEYVAAQKDVGGAPVYNLIVYVPTDEDTQYVDKKKLTNFKSVQVLRHEMNDRSYETRLAKKNDAATVVYWNPIAPIGELGVGETRIFSVMLTNDLFFCKTMIIDDKSPMCPMEFYNKINYKNLIPVEGEQPLLYLNKLLDDKINDFLICFRLETPTMIKILNIKKILSIFEYRNVTAKYAIYLPDQEVDSIFNKLMWERVRRLMKGDVSAKCSQINRHSLQYLKLATDMLGVNKNSKIVVSLVTAFQPLIMQLMIVPDVIIKLNNLDRQKRVRIYCKNDSFAITSYGPVPINMPDDNTYAFDYADINNNKYLYEKISLVTKDSNVDNLKVTAARYNYFF